MIDKIIVFSIRSKILILSLTAALVSVGTFALLKLPLDAVPDVTNNQVLIITQDPNLAAYEMEKFATAPIELAMANLPDMVEIRSISKFSLSNVTVIFKDNVDPYHARLLVLEKLNDLKKNLPNGVQPTLAPISTGLGEIFQYIIRPKNPQDSVYTLSDLRTIQDWVVRKKLLSTEGVADISSFGGYVKEYQAKVNPKFMRAANVTLEEIFRALEGGNGNAGGAYIEKDGTAFVIRGIGLIKNLEDIEKTIIKINNQVPVYIKDVAEVDYGATVRYGAMTINGEGETVGAVVLMRKGENAVNVIKNIKKSLSEIEKDLPKDLEIVPFIDRSVLISKTIKTVTANLLEGCLIVIVVLFIFLGDIRASLLAASVIPLSMMIAVILMNIFGVDGNLMSLGAIDFGLIVDSALLVIENVVFQLAIALKAHKNLTDKKLKDIEVAHACKEVKKSVVFGGLIILIVYFPIMTLSGIEGKMFTPMAMTVSFAILGALILSLTYVPTMATLVLKPHGDHKSFADKLVDFFYKGYQPLIEKAIAKKMQTIAGALVLLCAGILVFMKLGGEFIPRVDEGDYLIETRLPVGTGLTESKDFSTKLQKILLDSFPNEIATCVGKVGTSEIPTDPMPIEAFDNIIILKDEHEWKKVKTKAELTERIAGVYKNFPGVTYTISQPIENRFNELISGAKADVVIKIMGDDLDKLTYLGQQVGVILKNVKGCEDILVQKLGGLPQIVVTYDRNMLAYYGIQVEKVNQLIQTAFAGKTAGIIYEGERRFDLSVRLSSDYRANIEDIKQLLLSDKNGNLVPLSQVADIRVEIGPSEISRDKGQRRINVSFNVRGRDIESVVNEAKKLIEAKINLPLGYSFTYGGQFQNLLAAKERLSVVLPIALLIILALLFVTFGTIRESLMVFSAIPLAAVGGIFSLWARGFSFSISAGVGFICLFGVAVLNGILLISHFKKLGRETELETEELVKVALADKFRPIIMTSFVAAFGFLPMAFSTGAGGEVSKPLATVVIGGLLTATVLTLIVLPVIYILFKSDEPDADGLDEA
jgi:cobalt-zinc-cadmium resistance protein CzcA